MTDQERPPAADRDEEGFLDRAKERVEGEQQDPIETDEPPLLDEPERTRP